MPAPTVGPAESSVTAHGGDLGTRASRGGSWMNPDAKKENLLYISDLLAQVVDIYTYGPVSNSSER